MITKLSDLYGKTMVQIIITKEVEIDTNIMHRIKNRIATSLSNTVPYANSMHVIVISSPSD